MRNPHFLIIHMFKNRVDGTRQPGRAIHLREGKLWFQTSAALQPNPILRKALRINPKHKIGSRSPKGSLTLHPTSLWQLLRRRWRPFLGQHWRRGEGRHAAWATANLPYHKTLPNPGPWGGHSRITSPAHKWWKRCWTTTTSRIINSPGPDS